MSSIPSTNRQDASTWVPQRPQQPRPRAVASAWSLLLCLGLSGCLGEVSPTDSDTGAEAASRTAAAAPGLRFRVGPAAAVLGPTATAADSAFVAFNTGSLIRGYSANGTTYVLEGPTMESLKLTSTPAVVKGPTLDSFDGCGAWIEAVVPDGNTVRAWYHAEQSCNYEQWQTHKSVAYAESQDGGKTFTKPNYPYNQVLTGTNAPAPSTVTGLGDHTVVKWKNHYWMYFSDTVDWLAGVARAPVTSGGAPGAWTKWYNGAFSSPGLGGPKTSLGNVGSYASVYSTRQQVALIWPDAAHGGLKLSLSADGINFTANPDPLLPFEEQNWLRPASSELIVYPSIVGPTGGNVWSRSFYLFHVYLEPGADFSSRYLIRRQVTVSASSSSTAPSVDVALTRYHDAQRQDTWSTTAAVPTSYATQAQLGHVLTRNHPGTISLDDCYLPSWDDHMPSINGDCGGQQRLRRMGWIWSPTAAQPAGTRPLYRCFNQQQTNHLLSNAADCEGLGTMEFLLGYVNS